MYSVRRSYYHIGQYCNLSIIVMGWQSLRLQTVPGNGACLRHCPSEGQCLRYLLISSSAHNGRRRQELSCCNLLPISYKTKKSPNAFAQARLPCKLRVRSKRPVGGARWKPCGPCCTHASRVTSSSRPLAVGLGTLAAASVGGR